jgi:DNA-binding response OmpR family regulator
MIKPARTPPPLTLYLTTPNGITPLPPVEVRESDEYVDIPTDDLREALVTAHKSSPEPGSIFLRIPLGLVALHPLHQVVDTSHPFSFFHRQVTVVPTKRQAYFQDQPIKLTPKAYELLTYLGRRAGMAVTREVIQRDVWGAPMENSRTLDVHVRKLRQKIPGGIQTLKKVGYMAVGNEGSPHLSTDT